MNEESKLRALEDWLLDDGEKKTVKRYPTISVTVKSGDYIRVYKTNAFTIRALVVMMQRYNPQWEILAVKNGEFKTDYPNWTHIKEYSPEEEDHMDLIDHHPLDDKADLLRNNDYRTAINKYYCICASKGQYPSKSPFKGIRFWAPFEFPMKINYHPFFIPDDTPGITADVLRYYEGRRLSKMLNGEKVEGYYLTSPRIIDDDQFLNV